MVSPRLVGTFRAPRSDETRIPPAHGISEEDFRNCCLKWKQKVNDVLPALINLNESLIRVETPENVEETVNHGLRIRLSVLLPAGRRNLGARGNVSKFRDLGRVAMVWPRFARRHRGADSPALDVVLRVILGSGRGALSWLQKQCFRARQGAAHRGSVGVAMARGFACARRRVADGAGRAAIVATPRTGGAS